MPLKVEHLSHIYQQGTAMESWALRDISFEVEDGTFVGLIGHTGSGKSTLIQHLNGLIKPSEGTVYFDGEDIFAAGYDLKGLRAKVGLVFQYPEYQLFEQDILSDVKFGPKNMGLSDKEAEEKAIDALRLVRVDEKYFSRSPFELSGGQKRRVAIAGVLAMEPKVLILDEPTAGLDPKGRDEILESIDSLHKERGITIILVSHSMEDVAMYADRILVLDGSELKFFDTPKEVFKHKKELKRMGLAAPEITYLASDLRKAGIDIDDTISTVEEAKTEILRLLSVEKDKA
ncbi:MAG TPA: energy-coupling factor transporter ATPase [Candidatus Avilachnospira avistercoris]|nr:energy-coupling factor transporter ATPase [Candidatus Avilachnospira avistercoris]